MRSSACGCSAAAAPRAGMQELNLFIKDSLLESTRAESEWAFRELLPRARGYEAMTVLSKVCLDP